MLSELAFELVGKGHRIQIITSRQRYEAPDQHLPPHECYRGVEIHRVWTSRFGRANLAGRAIDYATFYTVAAWRLWRIARRDAVVISKTAPPMLSVITGPVARLRGCYHVNWLQDIFPEVAESFGVGGAKAQPAFRALRWLRNRSLRGAKDTRNDK